VVVTGDIEGVEAEGGGVVGEVRKPGVIVFFFDLRLSMVVDRFFYHFNAGGGASETLEHVDETGVWCFSDSVSGWDHEWGGCCYVDRGRWDDSRDSWG